MDKPDQALPESQVGLIRLRLIMDACVSKEEMNDNVVKTIERGYTPLNDYVGKYSGTASIVGSGPSIRFTHQNLTGDVMAVNQAIKYLLDNDIVPKFGMIWDADPVCEQFAIPHPDITYLVGARCHPKVFERLKDCKVIAWHAGGDHNINDLLVKHELNEPMVNGGSAGVTRVIYLLAALGYRDLHVYGADSCYSNEGDTHVIKSLVPEKDFQAFIGNGEGALCFRTTPEWCSQVNEFRDIYALFSHPDLNIEITVHGDGMLPHMYKLMKEKKDKGLIWNPDGSPHESTVFTEHEPQNLPENRDKLIEAGIQFQPVISETQPLEEQP